MFKLLQAIEDACALFERRVNIGISEHADEKMRHGVLWVNADVPGIGKRSLRAPIIIDRPHLIASGLNYATWRRLKQQVEKMGIDATHLELNISNEGKFCYKLDEFKEVYASTSGQRHSEYAVGLA